MHWHLGIHSPCFVTISSFNAFVHLKFIWFARRLCIRFWLQLVFFYTSGGKDSDSNKRDLDPASFIVHDTNNVKFSIEKNWFAIRSMNEVYTNSNSKIQKERQLFGLLPGSQPNSKVSDCQASTKRSNHMYNAYKLCALCTVHYYNVFTIFYSFMPIAWFVCCIYNVYYTWSRYNVFKLIYISIKM